MKSLSTRLLNSGLVVTLILAVWLFCVPVVLMADDLAEAPSAPIGRFKVGLAAVDMTPDITRHTVRMAGYSGRWHKPAEQILDPVYSRALVVEDAEGNLLGLVGLDLCNVTGELRSRVLEATAKYGFTDRNLMLAATHTHSAMHLIDSPVGKLLFGGVDQEVFDRTAAKVAESIIKAYQARRPARMETAVRHLTGMNRSRLDPAFHVETHSMENKKEPDPIKYPVDDRLTVIRFVAEDETTIGAVVHFAAHPTILSPKSLYLSADFPGVVCDLTQKALGPEAVVVYLNGALGDTAPTPDWDEEDVEVEVRQMREYGKQLADQTIGALSQALPTSDPVIGSGLVWREFPQVTIRPLKGWVAPVSISRWFKKDPRVPFQVLRLGELVLIGVPGEPTTAVGKKLAALVPSDRQGLVVGQANDSVAYIVTETEYADGTYAADACVLGPQAADLIAEGFSAALAELR